MKTIYAFSMPGGWELVVIVAVFLVFFGPKKIPEIARGVGRGIREFQNAAKEIRDEIQKIPGDESKPKT